MLSNKQFAVYKSVFPKSMFYISMSVYKSMSGFKSMFYKFIFYNPSLQDQSSPVESMVFKSNPVECTVHVFQRALIVITMQSLNRAGTALKQTHIFPYME